MDKFTQENLHSNRENMFHEETHVKEAATDLLNESKKKANEMYKDGKNKLCDVQESIKNYSDEVVHKVHKKPIVSLLMAAGIGFILSSLLRR